MVEFAMSLMEERLYLVIWVLSLPWQLAMWAQPSVGSLPAGVIGIGGTAGWLFALGYLGGWLADHR